MSQRVKPADSLCMPHSKPFHWLLAVGMMCSLAGLAFTRIPGESAAVVEAPATDTSAPNADSSASPVATEAVVTEETPVVPTATPAADVALLAGVAATPTPAIEAAPVTAIQSIPANLAHPVELVRVPDKARGLLDAMNEARISQGLTPLEWDASLEEVAYARARNLVENGYFDHYAPDGESAFSELAARGIRYRLAGENLARNNYVENRTVAAAFDGLMNSPGHRANILEPRFSSVAVAAVRDGKMWIYVTVFLN